MAERPSHAAQDLALILGPGHAALAVEVDRGVELGDRQRHLAHVGFDEDARQAGGDLDGMADRGGGDVDAGDGDAAAGEGAGHEPRAAGDVQER